MKTTSIWTAFRGQHKADEAALYMTRLYVTVYVYALQESFVRKNTFRVVLYKSIFIQPFSVRGSDGWQRSFPAVPAPYE